MVIEIKVPSPGESIVQVQIASWLFKDGDRVQKDAEIAEIDSDKATLSITAEEEGKLHIKEFADKARTNKITLEEMTGGTFTITNGGIFGSLMSTPILNPPQSAILGMHKIMDRPLAIEGKVEIRPMMYVALSYDHRIIDGRESVGFLVKVKEMLEDPVQLMHAGDDPIKILLNL